jgi:hypothetical protein
MKRATGIPSRINPTHHGVAHMLPDALRAVAQHHHWSQLRRRAVPGMPLHHIQCAPPRCLSTQAARERHCRLTCRYVARLPQLLLLPATHYAESDLMPTAVHHGPVQAPIAITHYDAIGLDYELPRRRCMLRRWRVVRLLDVRYAARCCPSTSVPIRSACVRNVSVPTWTPASSLSNCAASRNVVIAPSAGSQRARPSLVC